MSKPIRASEGIQQLHDTLARYNALQALTKLLLKYGQLRKDSSKVWKLNVRGLGAVRIEINQAKPRKSLAIIPFLNGETKTNIHKALKLIDLLSSNNII